MKILDSDHCVAILRGTLNLAGKVTPDEELAITAISVGELTHGAHKSSHPAENLARLDVLLAALSIIPYDESAARRFGAIKAHLQAKGQTVDDLDLQIASIVIENNATLFTHNQRHFARIPNLKLENWL